MINAAHRPHCRSLRTTKQGCTCTINTYLRSLTLHQGGITSQPCTAVRWVPSSPTLFLAAYADGTIIVFDKEREDGLFKAQDPDTADARSSDSDSDASGPGWNPRESMVVSIPPWHPVAGTRPDKDKTVKNPVSHWKVSRRAIVGKSSAVGRATVGLSSRQTLFSRPTSSTSLRYQKTGACESSTHWLSSKSIREDLHLSTNHTSD
jgi:hypothetical protein